MIVTIHSDNHRKTTKLYESYTTVYVYKHNLENVKYCMSSKLIVVSGVKSRISNIFFLMRKNDMLF